MMDLTNPRWFTLIPNHCRDCANLLEIVIVKSISMVIILGEAGTKIEMTLNSAGNAATGSCKVA